MGKWESPSLAVRKELDKLTLEMESFRLANPDWRNRPEWREMCERFGPLYISDYAWQRAHEKEALAS